MSTNQDYVMRGGRASKGHGPSAMGSMPRKRLFLKINFFKKIKHQSTDRKNFTNQTNNTKHKHLNLSRESWNISNFQNRSNESNSSDQNLNENKDVPSLSNDRGYPIIDTTKNPLLF